jgi:hypothetical protein
MQQSPTRYCSCHKHKVVPQDLLTQLIQNNTCRVLASRANTAHIPPTTLYSPPVSLTTRCHLI